MLPHSWPFGCFITLMLQFGTSIVQCPGDGSVLRITDTQYMSREFWSSLPSLISKGVPFWSNRSITLYLVQSGTKDGPVCSKAWLILV